MYYQIKSQLIRSDFKISLDAKKSVRILLREIILIGQNKKWLSDLRKPFFCLIIEEANLCFHQGLL